MNRGLRRLTQSCALSLLLCSFLHRGMAEGQAEPTPEPPPPEAAGTEAPAAASPAPSSEASPSTIQALEQRIQQLEQAQIENQLNAEDQSDAAALVGPELFRVYGFADFGINKAWVGEHSFLRGLAQSETTFALGNLNLYFHFQPDPAWQVLAEIRFTAYPHGDEESLATPLGGEYVRTDTQVVDVASPSTSFRFRWGSIFIERAYGQYTYSEQFSIKVGQFLTPYGIWNVDHGTPTLIALMMPHFVSTEVFPARQIGVALAGTFMFSSWELSYDAYVSNGRTATQLDFTANKSFGGRLKLGRMAPLPLAIGTSFYYGQIDDITKSITSFAPFVVDREFIVEGTETGVGVDASLDVDALRIRAEGIMRATRYTDGKRPQLVNAAPGVTKPDNNEYDGYLLAAYRLPWWGLEPFLYGEYDHFVSPYGDDQAVLAVGLNIHFTEFAQLKTEVARVLFFDWNADGAWSDNNMTLLFSRLAIAF
ncbi:MAG TPA: hypothetical protein VJV78_14125 [Polyangiales bacterium]|nr:hypothetical protein [Polyangiales bacterium]